MSTNWSKEKVKYGTYVVMLIWAVLISASYYFNWRQEKDLVRQMAITEARSSYNKDLVYRRWSAEHGGVYVPPTKDYPPNPYLSHIPQRDVVTTDGLHLTLTNPAYMTRQVHELGKKQYGERGHITSLTPLRPENRADTWEAEALKAFETGVSEYIALSAIDELPYMRFMKPMVTEEGCLKCHANQGYKLGDILGGISVSVPFKPYLDLLNQHNRLLASAHSLIAILGFVGIGFSGRSFSKAQEDLSNSELRHRMALSAAQGGVWEWDVTTDEEYFSPRFCEIIGYSFEDPELPHTFEAWEKRIHPDDHDHVMSVLTDHLEKNNKYDVVYRHLHKSGEYRWQKSVGDTERDRSGKPKKMYGYISDITEQINAEKDMALMSFAMDHIDEEVFLIDASSRIKYVNNKSCENLGYTKEELLTSSVANVDPYFPEKHWADHWQELKECGSLKFETFHSRKDGTLFPVEITANYFEFNGIGYNLALAIDLTERKRSENERLQFERQMVQTQKLESLGVLAGGVAHDFNNLLAAIMGHSELTKRRLPSSSPAVENLKQIEQAAERAADLAKQMLAYSGKGKFVIETFNLNELLDEMLHMLQVSISKKAVLRINHYKGLPAVEADATQLRQIVMNLVINASEAIGEKSGVISITTGCMDCDEQYLKNVWLNEDLSDGLYVYLEISDTGCGMDATTLTKLFDPFFTTKFTGRGLGMSAVMGIVRGHKGAIKVYSEPEKGTTFKILLPAAEKPTEIFNTSTEDDQWVGNGKALLVDDEETVRGIGTEMLKELGLTPLTATDGRDALQVFEQNPDIDLVILDLTMPKMDGEQCFRELKKLNPDIKVIMSSGYNEFEVSQRFIGKGIAGFVQKPYKLSVLRHAIKSVS